MAQEKCGCGGEHQGCQACGADAIFSYWCETCQRSVAEKRCPYCGLKTQRKRE
jgi:predicted RNA-binding protein with PUA domain